MYVSGSMTYRHTYASKSTPTSPWARASWYTSYMSFSTPRGSTPQYVWKFGLRKNCFMPAFFHDSKKA